MLCPHALILANIIAVDPEAQPPRLNPSGGTMDRFHENHNTVGDSQPPACVVRDPR